MAKKPTRKTTKGTRTKRKPRKKAPPPESLLPEILHPSLNGKRVAPNTTVRMFHSIEDMEKGEVWFEFDAIEAECFIEQTLNPDNKKEFKPDRIKVATTLMDWFLTRHSIEMTIGQAMLVIPAIEEVLTAAGFFTKPKQS